MDDNAVINSAEARVRKKVQGTYKLSRIMFWIAFALVMIIPPILGTAFKALYVLLWMTPLFVLVDILILRHLFRYLDIEYEYAVVSGELRVSKIFGNERRAEWVTVKFADMSVIAPYEGTYKKDLDARTDIVRRYEAVSSLDAADCYYGTFTNSDGEKSVVFFEPTKKILDLAKLFNHSTVVKAVKY
jgi:hypothetical protein